MLLHTFTKNNEIVLIERSESQSYILYKFLDNNLILKVSNLGQIVIENIVKRLNNDRYIKLE